VFANGPHHIQALPSETNPDPAPPNPNDPEDKQARAWFMARNNVYEGWDASVTYLKTLCREQGPFDGVLGFSQGASLAAILAASLEHPERTPETSEPIQNKPFRFVISVSGFRPADPKFDPLFRDQIQTPVMLIVGANDSIVTSERSQTLVERCANIRVVRHPGEHYLPTSYVLPIMPLHLHMHSLTPSLTSCSAPWRTFLRDCITSFARSNHDWQSIPSPADDTSQDACNKL
jgi:dihydrofolate reductase